MPTFSRPARGSAGVATLLLAPAFALASGSAPAAAGFGAAPAASSGGFAGGTARATAVAIGLASFAGGARRTAAAAADATTTDSDDDGEWVSGKEGLAQVVAAMAATADATTTASDDDGEWVSGKEGLAQVLAAMAATAMPLAASTQEAPPPLQMPMVQAAPHLPGATSGLLDQRNAKGVQIDVNAPKKPYQLLQVPDDVAFPA